MKPNRLSKTLVLLIIIFIGGQLLCFAADASSGEKGTTIKKTKNNINFNLPDDWPIQEKNGTTGPVPIEEYLAFKFADIGTRLSKLEETVSGFNGRIKTLEDQLKRPKKLREGDLIDHGNDSEETQNT